MTDFTRGYTAGWAVARVNPATWADDGEIAGVGAISVSRGRTDAVRLLETATMEVEGGLDEGWYRIYLEADQGARGRHAVATMLFERIGSHVGHGTVARARGRSVLQPAADARMHRGGFTPAGADAAAWCARMLASCTPAPVTASGSFALAEDLVHAPGRTVLAAVWDALDAGGFCIRIGHDGSVDVGPVPTAPALALDRAHAGLLVPGVDEDFDLTAVPNRYTAVFADGEQAVAENRDAASAVSFESRGRWVDAPTDTSPKPLAGETRQAYVDRRLAELSTVTRTYGYTREFWPGVVPYDAVSATLPANGLDGELRVITQNLTRDHGAVVAEVAGLDVRL